MDGSNTTGSFFGIVAGFYTSVTSNPNIPSKEALIQTIILSAAGGIVGWVVVELAKLLKSYIKKLKTPKSDDKTNN